MHERESVKCGRDELGIIPQEEEKGCSQKYSQSVVSLKEQQKHSKRKKVLFLVGSNKGNAHKKNKNTHKKV